MIDRMVLVEWRDSCFDEGWKTQKRALRHSTSNCRTIGFLLKNKRDSVTVVESQSDTGHVDAVMAIPRGCITKITRLKV
jgi:hypothetical protein